MANVIEEQITIILKCGSTSEETFYTLNESTTISDLKEKIYKIHGHQILRQRILGRYPEHTTLRVMSNDEKLVNGGNYILIINPRRGARTKQDLDDPHRHLMNTINNRIPE